MKFIYVSLVAIFLASCSSSSSKWDETSAFLDFEDKTTDGAKCPAVIKVKYAKWDPLQEEGDAKRKMLAVELVFNSYSLDKGGDEYIQYAPNDFDYLLVECDGHGWELAGSFKGKNQYLLYDDNRCYYRFSIE